MSLGASSSVVDLPPNFHLISDILFFFVFVRYKSQPTPVTKRPSRLGFPPSRDSRSPSRTINTTSWREMGGSTAAKHKSRGSRILRKLKARIRRTARLDSNRDRDNDIHEEEVVVLDGSDICELVENKEVFDTYVDHKFRELDRDRDGKLSVEELQPAVADIGAALGLPAKGQSAESDQIYSEVLNEFTHGEKKEVSKSEFKEVFSDILLGMAAGLNRDPIVILRMDGEDLKEFIASAEFELEAVALYSKLESENVPLLRCISMALETLTVENGMPPSSDSWVTEHVVNPALLSVSDQQLQNPASEELFLVEFKKVLEVIARRLNEHPVIVAHSENTFDGSGIKNFLSNKFELDKILNTAWNNLPKDRHHKVCKQHLRVVLDDVGPSAGLPPYGAINQVDSIMDEALRLVSASDGKAVHEDEFKKLVMEILGSIMLQLVGSPIYVSSNSVVHEPVASSSTLLTPQPTTSPHSR